jgi:hypothetical protein
MPAEEESTFSYVDLEDAVEMIANEDECADSHDDRRPLLNSHSRLPFHFFMSIFGAFLLAASTILFHLVTNAFWDLLIVVVLSVPLSIFLIWRRTLPLFFIYLTKELDEDEGVREKERTPWSVIKEWAANVLLVVLLISSICVFGVSLGFYIGAAFPNISWTAWPILVPTISCVTYCVVSGFLAAFFNRLTLRRVGRRVLKWGVAMLVTMLIFATGLPFMVYPGIEPFLYIFNTVATAIAVISGGIIFFSMNRGVGKCLVLFLVVLSPVTLYLCHAVSALSRESSHNSSSSNGTTPFPGLVDMRLIPDRPEQAFNTTNGLLNGTTFLPGSVDIRFSPDRSEQVSTTVGSSSDETKGPPTKVIESSESGITTHTSCATTSDPLSGSEDKAPSDVEIALRSNGIEFLAVPKHENDSYAKTLEIPVITRSQILEIVGRLNLNFGNEKQNKNWKWVIGSLRGGSIVDYSGFCLWVRGARTIVDGAKKLRESPGNGGLGENEIRIIEMFDKSLEEMSCDGSKEVLLPYFNVKFNIWVCKFHYDIWPLPNLAKDEEDLAALLEQAKGDVCLVTDGVDRLSSLAARGDISLWVASVTNLVEKIDNQVDKRHATHEDDSVRELRGGFKHLGNVLTSWNNETDPSRTNDIGYSNERTRVLNGLLEMWGGEYEKIFIDDLEEMMKVYLELFGLVDVFQDLRVNTAKWILDYNDCLESVNDIGFGLNRINWGAVKGVIDKNPVGVGSLLDSARLSLWNSFTIPFLLQSSLRQEHPPPQESPDWGNTTWSIPADFNVSEASNLMVHLAVLSELLTFPATTNRSIIEGTE